METIIRRTIHVLPLSVRYPLFGFLKERVVRNHRRPEWVRSAAGVVMRNTLGKR